MNNRPFVIHFEGPDGTGKSTQIKMLDMYLHQQGKKCLVVKEPGFTAAGDIIRQRLIHGDKLDPEVEFALFTTNRVLLSDYLDKADPLDYILFDRSWISSYVYQGLLGGMNLDRIISISRAAYSKEYYFSPDHIFFFKMTYEEFLKRNKEKDNFTDHTKDTWNRLSKEYAEASFDCWNITSSFINNIDASTGKDNIHKIIKEFLEE
jgi:dTMP kinase